MRCFLISSVFLLFYSGQISDPPEWMIFRVYSSDNEWLGVDTLCIPVLKSNSILKHYRKKEFLLISEKGIEEINQKKLGKLLLFSFQDTTQLSPYNINTCIPFIKSDSKLVARKLLPSDYEIYKYRTDYYSPSGHDIKFVYINPNDGIVLWIDYFGKRFYVNSSYDHVLDELLEDSTLFEYPKFFPAPPMPR